MTITVEDVVISVTAKLDKAKGDLKGLDAQFDSSAGKMQRAAKSLEGHLDQLGRNSTDSFSRVGAAAGKAANDIDRSAGRIANGTRNLGRQIADVGAQAASGTNGFLIFAQQAPQFADALADTGGRGAALASFFAGPWGAAILAAGSILGTVLIPRLLEGGDAADTMSAAQADLKNFVDLTTGAINRQTTAVQRLAAAQARQSTIEDTSRSYVAARGGAIGAVRDASGQKAPSFAAGVQLPTSTSNDPIKLRLREIAAEAVRTRQPINDFALAVRAAVGDRPEYRELVKTVTAQASAAVTAAQGVQRLKAEQALLTGTATAQQRALLGLGLATSSTIEKQVQLATATTAVEKARARLALVEERGRSIAAGDGAALKQYRVELTAANSAVNAAEAAEKGASEAKRGHARATREAAKAERDRAKAVRETAREERELISLRGDLASARSDLTSDPVLQDRFARDRVGLDRAGRTSDIEERRDRDDLSAAEFAERKKLIDDISDARLAYIERTASIRAANDGVELARANIGQQQDVLQAQADLADTARGRRAIELKILDLQIEEQRLIAQKVLDLAKEGKASPQEARLAQLTLDGLPALKQLGTDRITRDTEGPLARYRRGAFGDIQDKVESIEAQGLQALEDQLLASTKAALGLSGALGDVVGELLRIGLQRRLIGPLANALFGPAEGGGTGGAVGGLLNSLARSFGGGRAVGGPVSSGKTYLVGERGPELLHMGGASGTVVPNNRLGAPPSLGAMGANVAVRPASSVTVIHAPQTVLHSPVVTSDLIREMDARNQASLRAAAPHIAQAGANQAMKQQGYLQKLGQPGSRLR